MLAHASYSAIPVKPASRRLMKDGDLALFLYGRKCQERKRSVMEGCWGEGGEREEGGGEADGGRTELR